MKEKDLGVKSFISALIVIAILMCASYALTFVLPGGQYTRALDELGHEIIDTSKPFEFVESGMPLYKFLLSPILVLTMEGSGTIIAIIIFLLIIGGIFKCLEEAKIMNYLLDKITYQYVDSKYKLIKLVSLFFMLMGTLMGSAEEIIPLVPIVVSLSIALGFDNLTGLAMSVLAGGCGFATAVMNPFNVGIGQKLAGLPMYSGYWYRAIIFVIVYLMLIFFITSHAKKIDRPVDKQQINFKQDPLLEKASKGFITTMAIGLVFVMLSCVITALQDYTLIIVALMFLVGGISACVIGKVAFKTFIHNFKDGAISIAPAILTILMASSIKYILVEGKILDTVLYFLINTLDGIPSTLLIFFVYLIFLIMEIFIASGTAKAFLLMPLILPVCQVFNVSARLCVLAFAFGDGFANEIYPTNAGLLVSLSLAKSSVKEWLKYAWKFFLVNFFLTCIALFIGVYIGY